MGDTFDGHFELAVGFRELMDDEHVTSVLLRWRIDLVITEIDLALCTHRCSFPPHTFIFETNESLAPGSRWHSRRHEEAVVVLDQFRHGIVLLHAAADDDISTTVGNLNVSVLIAVVKEIDTARDRTGRLVS